MTSRSYKTAKVRSDVWDKDGGCCHYCGKQLHPFREFQVDHVIPRCKGGTDDIENLVAACSACNQSKNGTVSTRWGNTHQLTEKPNVSLLVLTISYLLEEMKRVEERTRKTAEREFWRDQHNKRMAELQSQSHKDSLQHAIWMITQIPKIPKRDRAAFRLSPHCWEALEREFFISDK